MSRNESKNKHKRQRLLSSASAPSQSSSILSFFAPLSTTTAQQSKNSGGGPPAPLQTPLFAPTPPLNEEALNPAPSAPPSSLEEWKKDEEELAEELAAPSDPLDDVDTSDANDDESSHGPLINPLRRSHRCAPLQLLNMKLSSRPLSSPVPPCLAKAGGKRFSRRVRCASDVPRDDSDRSSSSRQRRAVTSMSLSSDGLLLAVAWADGRLSVYHADDVEYNDARVAFRGGEPGEPDKDGPLDPLVTFKQVRSVTLLLPTSKPFLTS